MGKLKTSFKSNFSNTVLEVYYYGDEGLCISIYNTDKSISIEHVFTLNKGSKRLIKLIKHFTKHS